MFVDADTTVQADDTAELLQSVEKRLGKEACATDSSEELCGVQAQRLRQENTSRRTTCTLPQVSTSGMKGCNTRTADNVQTKLEMQKQPSAVLTTGEAANEREWITDVQR